MAHLVAIQTANGEWQAFVVAHPSNRFAGDIDVLGRKLPSFCHMQAWDGVARADARRLALSLRGVPRAARHAAILKAAEGLRRSASAGTPRQTATAGPLRPPGPRSRRRRGPSRWPRTVRGR